MLIGEGVEEVYFFEALLSELRIPGVQVEQYNGKSGLGSYLKALRNRSGFTRLEKLGITRDADEDPTGAAASVDGAVAQASFPTNLTVTKLILPGNSQIGALENLCLRSISGQAIEVCIEDYIACAARATGISHRTTTNKAKARVHTWLASQEEPDLRLGHAAKKSLVNWDTPAFDEVKGFLRSLA